MIKVSVIIPVYNREKTLERCLNSVVNQTLQEIEIIVVDDGSVDNSHSIIEKYCELYGNKIVKVFQQNQGAATARNVGLKYAQGEYITFLDSDDYMEFDGLEKMYSVARDRNADIVCAPIYEVKNTGVKVIGRYVGNLKKEDLMEKTLRNLYNKIFKRELIEKTGVVIPNFILGEDTAFSTVLMSWAKEIVYLNYPYYFYELSENSLSNINWGKEWVVNNAGEVKEWIMQHINPEFKEIARVILAQRLLHLYRTHELYRTEIKEYLKENEFFYLYAYGTNPNYSVIRNRLKDILFHASELIPNRIIMIDTQKNNRCENSDVSGCEVVSIGTEECKYYKNSNTDLAYENDDMRFVTTYFALCSIYEKGGIYLSEEIKVSNSLNLLRDNQVFFSFESCDTISNNIFGALAGNEIIGEIISDLAEMKYSPNLLQYVFDKVIFEKSNIKRTNIRQKIETKGLTVYENMLLLIPKKNALSIAYDYKIDSEKKADILTSQIEWLERKVAYQEKLISKKSNTIKDNGGNSIRIFLNTLIENGTKFAIYGAGIKGQRFVSQLSDKAYKNMQFFLVTSEEGNPSEINGKEVVVAKKETIQDDLLILIVMKPEFAQQAEQRLDRLEHAKYLYVNWV